MTLPDPRHDNLRSYIAGIPFAMLATRAADGSLHSRPMVVLHGDDDDVLWFFTGSTTPKAVDVILDGHVNVSYSDPATHRYISVSGTAELVTDRQEMIKRWHAGLIEWIPLGINDPDMSLLKVTVLHVEHWEPALLAAGRTTGAHSGLDHDESMR